MTAQDRSEGECRGPTTGPWGLDLLLTAEEWLPPRAFLHCSQTQPRQQPDSLSNSPCPLGRARGRGRYNLLARAINNKPFQCSDGRISPQRRCAAAREGQGDLFKFYGSGSVVALWHCSTARVSLRVLPNQDNLGSSLGGGNLTVTSQPYTQQNDFRVGARRPDGGISCRPSRSRPWAGRSTDILFCSLHLASAESGSA